MSLFDTLTGMIFGDSAASGFRSRMNAIAQQLGELLTWDDDGSPICALSMNIRGEQYVLVVALTGETVRLSAMSKIKFPPGGLPRAVIDFLVQKNREEPNCDFDSIDARRHSYFCVRAVVRHWTTLTTSLMRTAVDELGSRIAALDILMIREGFAY